MKHTITTQILAGNLGDGWNDQDAAADALAEYTERIWTEDMVSLGYNESQFEIDIEVQHGCEGSAKQMIVYSEEPETAQDIVENLTDEGQIWERFCNSKENKKMDISINNITYELSEYAVSFDFTISPGNSWHTAELQFPDTPDAQHLIDGEDFDIVNEVHYKIYTKLKEYFFGDFKDLKCTIASATIGKNVVHVEEVNTDRNDYYVAFLLDDYDEVILQRMTGYEDYYNEPVIFEKGNVFGIEEDDLTSKDIIEKAKDQYFDDLEKSLTTKMQKLYDSIDINLVGEKEIAQYFDEKLNEFLNDEFYFKDCDWDEVPIAQEFYENNGVDIRQSFIDDLIHENFFSEKDSVKPC